MNLAWIKDKTVYVLKDEYGDTHATVIPCDDGTFTYHITCWDRLEFKPLKYQKLNPCLAFVTIELYNETKEQFYKQHLLVEALGKVVDEIRSKRNGGRPRKKVVD